jgi:tetratricopeptide (TPR) repeat protein
MLAISASVALLAVLVVAGLATGMVLLSQANKRIEEQRDLARQKQRLARDAVDDMYSDVAEEWLHDQPRLQPVQKKFLQKALRYYEEFAREDDTDPDVRLKTAIAYARIGHMEFALGNSEKKRKSFEQALNLLKRLVADFPDRQTYRLQLARLYILPLSGMADLDRGLQLANELVDEAPDVPECWQLMADGNNLLSIRQGYQKRFAEAEKSARQYVAWAERLLKELPDEPKYAQQLANAHNTLGEILNYSGRFSEAEREYLQALELAERAVALSPTHPDRRLQLAIANLNLGEILSKTGRAKQAEARYLRYVAVVQKVIEDFPDRPYLVNNLADGFSRLTDLYQELGRREDALDASRKKVVLYAKLMDDRPDGSAYLQLLLAANYKLVSLLQKGDQDQAGAERDKVIRRLAKLIELKPDEVTCRYYCALMRAEAGDLTGYRNVCAAMLDHFDRTKNPADAYWVAWTLVLAPDSVKDLDQAVKLAEIAVRSDPKNDAYSLTLASALYRAGRFSEAIQRLNDSAASGLAATKPSSPLHGWFFLAMAHRRLGHVEEAHEWLDKASKRVEQETKNPSSEANRAWNRRLTWQLLRKEAEALLKQSGQDRDKANEKEKSQAKPAKG